MELNNKKIVNGWCMYDWANSVYSLVITTAIFPIYYSAATESVFGSDKVNFFGIEIINTVLYSYALSFSFLVVAVVLPLLSGIADYTGNKKIFMKIFVYTGAVACMGLYLFDGANVEWGILCSVVASIGFSGSLIFYDAYLPEIVTLDRVDKVSARGYSFGYIGSVILLVVNLGMILNYEAIGFSSEGQATRLAFLMVGLWWAGFSQISFYRLPTLVHSKPENTQYLSKGYNELKKVFRSLANLKEVRIFLVAFFFYNMGVQTIILLATPFASKVLGMEADSLILTILIIQLVAIGGAYLFAQVSEKFGNKRSILTMIFIWAMVCIGAFLVQNEFQFYAIAAVLGLVLGGIQSLSRSTYSKLIPADTLDHASYFSFLDVTYYLSVVFGTFFYGLVEQVSEDMRKNALVLAMYFVIGFIVLSRMKEKFAPRLEK